MRIIITIVVLILSIQLADAQASIIKIDQAIKLPKDSVESENLQLSLHHFLIAAQADATKNNWTYPPHYLETTVLLDEIEGIDKNEKTKADSFYEPHLLEVVPIGKGRYFIKVSYIGVQDGAPRVRANFELIAHKSEDKFLFSSTLIRNTRTWKKTTLGNYTYHYRDTLNIDKIQEYQKLTSFFDERLNLTPKKTIFYLFEDGLMTQQYFGLPYKLDYNGEGENMRWSVLLENQEIHVMNSSRLFQFDPHDLWHNRLVRVKSRRAVNHAVDEGIATLYGGSWGFSWQELFAAFEEEIKFDKSTDWLNLRKDRVAFVTDGHRNPTDFMINALLVQEIEKEMGFSGVWELLNAKEETAYFKTLEKLTGISKNNYNKKVWALIKKEMSELKRKQAKEDKANG